MAMTMSPADIKESLVRNLHVLSKKDEMGEQRLNYALHDLTFWLDAIGDSGFGDAPDDMNIVTSARTECVNYNELSRWNEHLEVKPSLEQTLLSGGLVGVVTAPVLGTYAAPIATMTRIVESNRNRFRDMGPSCGSLYLFDVIRGLLQHNCTAVNLACMLSSAT